MSHGKREKTQDTAAHKENRHFMKEDRLKLVSIKGWEVGSKIVVLKRKSPENNMNERFWAFPWLFRVQPDAGAQRELTFFHIKTSFFEDCCSLML